MNKYLENAGVLPPRPRDTHTTGMSILQNHEEVDDRNSRGYNIKTLTHGLCLFTLS